MEQYFTNSKAPTLATTYNATLSSSVVVTLNAGTTTVQITAVLKGIFLRWNGAASSSSFDEFIALDSTRVFVVPAGTTTANFIEEAASAHLVLIEK